MSGSQKGGSKTATVRIVNPNRRLLLRAFCSANCDWRDSPVDYAYVDLDAEYIEVLLERMRRCQEIVERTDDRVYFVAHHDSSAMFFENPKGGLEDVYGPEFMDDLECNEQALEPESVVQPHFELYRTSLDTLRVLPDQLYWQSLEKHGDDELYTTRVHREDLIAYRRKMGWKPDERLRNKGRAARSKARK